MIHPSVNVLLWASQKQGIYSSVLLLLLACMLLEATVYGNCTGNSNKLFSSLLMKLTLWSETPIHFQFHIYAFSIIQFRPSLIHVSGLMCWSERSFLYFGIWIICLFVIPAWWIFGARINWNMCSFILFAGTCFAWYGFKCIIYCLSAIGIETHL